MTAFLILMIIAGTSFGELADLEREARLASEAEAGLFDGEIVYLNDGKRDFLSIITESMTDEIKGAVLVLHGRGNHPDWYHVAGPVRVGLAEQGWTTLSLQMPVLRNGAKYYDYVPMIPESFPRIDAGIRYLREQGFDWVAVVAHSCSVHMTIAWIREFGDETFNAYVGIGMGATDFRQYMAKPFPFDQMQVPILDVYGSEDFNSVTSAAPDRLELIEAGGNDRSNQAVIAGTDHYFENHEDELIAAISEWLTEVRN